ncbi:MAG: type II toxin-antitoxin system prevent-host-death family antitoxin [Gammaproteobacteria bacterium]|nr:type II toxin-antitoxin system prevent-host-death family antitoxin [Gammaproteobacteria bacterium]
MHSVNIHEAKTHLSQLLVEVETKSKRILICRNGTPVAELVPVTKKTINPLQQYRELRGIKILYDPTQPASEDEWPQEHR